MSAQSTEQIPVTTSARNYGTTSVVDMRPNGVMPTVVDNVSSTGVVVDGALGNPNLHDTVPVLGAQSASEDTTSTELRPEIVDPPYGEPERSANVITSGASTQPVTPSRQVFPTTPQTPPGSATTVRVQEFYSAESTTSMSEERNVRWMSRFTEFMRTAASRGASGWDRVMDGLGLVHVHGHQTLPQYQGNTFTGRQRVEQMNFSPPEEIPGPHAGVQRPPTSWTTAATAPPQPLFDASQVAQFRQAHRDHPLIYGQSSEVGSDRSSRLQAEVQRQLEEYTAKYQEDLRSLQDEVNRLRSEKREWEERGNVRSVQGGRVPSVQPSAPGQLPGNPGGPQGSLHLTADGHNAQPSAPGLLQGNPRGPQGSLHLTADGHNAQPSAPGLLQGNPRGPQGSLHLTADGHNAQPSAPGQLPGNPGGPQGSLHLTADGHSAQPSAPGLLQGNPRGPQGSLHLRTDGPSEGPPGPKTQDKGGMSNVRDQATDPTVDGEKETSSTTRATTATEPEKEAQGATSTPSQWLGGTAGPDPLALLAGGMAQLQAAMLSQMRDKTKEKDEDRSPEAVKPGSNVLPSLPELNQQTSSVDIMDWLEVITTTMQDLSDGSAEWWTRVRALANEAYARWTSASPVEKLSIYPPREEALESGKWSRVNSRAASMILMALPDAVKQEMVQRRSTGSVSSLLFRLLTLYQPGGQQEKVTLLQSLQQPKSEQNAVDAVKSLRAWARWLRRCKELEVAAPDPTLLTPWFVVDYKGGAGKGAGSELQNVPRQKPSAGGHEAFIRDC